MKRFMTIGAMMFVLGFALVTGAEKSPIVGIIGAALLCGSAFVFNYCDKAHDEHRSVRQKLPKAA